MAEVATENRTKACYPEEECFLSKCKQFLIVRLKKMRDVDGRNYLLKSFYDGLMLENFPMEDELDPFGSWLTGIEDEGGSTFEVLLFFDARRNELLTHREILGGSVVEFFSESRCGLLSYFVVSKKERGRGLAKQIIDTSVATLQTIAKEMYPDMQYCPVFAETNNPHRVAAEDDSLTPNVRLGVLHNLGFGLLDCQYVQPPLSKAHKPCADLLLTVFAGPHCNLPYEVKSNGHKNYFLPTSLVFSWVEEFWLTACECDDSKELEWSEWWSVRADMLTKGEKLPVLDLRSRRKLEEKDRAKL